MTKARLFELLTQGPRRIGKCNTAEMVTINGVTGILCAIEREDGSGHNFNVTLIVGLSRKQTVFVRTID